MRTLSGDVSGGATFPISSFLKKPGSWALTGFPQGDVRSPLTSYAYCAAAKPKGKRVR